jgi:phage gpG-like protein
LLNFTINIKPLEERLNVIIGKLQNPNWDDIGQIMLTSVMTNFEVGGRPAWQKPINPREFEPLINTGRLRNQYVINKGTDFVSITWTAPYASVHQSIETQRPKVSQQMHNFFLAKLIDARENNSPDLDMWKGLYKKKLGTPINIPQRRFAMFQEEDKKLIIQKFEESIK